MTRTTLVLAALTTLLIPSAARAQTVVASIALHEGPVAGRFVIGHPLPPPAPILIYRHPAYRPAGWYTRHGYRTVRVWCDRDHDCYYDRFDRGRPGLQEMTVYERGGRYYR